MTTALWLVAAAAAIAAYTDVTRRRIPNVLVVALLVAGLTLAALNGTAAFLTSVGLLAAALAAGTALFSLGVIGGGDVKLIAAGAATLGWPDAVPFVLYTLIAGGVLGLAVSLARGRFLPMLRNVRAITFPMYSGLRPVLAQSTGTMPYALAILAGALCVALTNLHVFNLRIPL